jgi:acyl-CoA thioester hydrolase
MSSAPPTPPDDASSNASSNATVGTARSVVRVRVRFGETDLMGIVHHGSYPAYFEVARVEWLRRRGVAYGTWASRGMHLAVAEMTLRYRSPARFDDELDVEATLALVRAASLRFDYRLVRVADSVLIAEGSTLLACVNEAGAPRRMSAEVTEVLGRAEG